MKYKFQHMHSWRSVAQRDEHWQTMPEIPGSNPARSPQWIICSGGAGPDQTREMTEEMTDKRTRPRVEQTREMTEEQLTRDWNSRPDGGACGWRLEQQTGWRSVCLNRRLEQQTGWRSVCLNRRLEQQTRWNGNQSSQTTARRRVMTAPEERRRGDHDRGPPPASKTMTSSSYESCFFFLNTPKKAKITCLFHKLPATPIYAPKMTLIWPRHYFPYYC